MKKTVLPLMAVAMTLSLSACQKTDTVAPALEAAKTNDDLILDVLNAAAVNKGGETVTMAAKPSAAQIKAAFDAFDADKSGQISSTELEGVLIKVGVKINLTQVAQIIKMFDTNNSGMMEFNEFERLIEEALKHANTIK